jgi:hypothetical protein
MTEKKAKIARITVTVKGKDVSLPVSEAKELFEGLREIFEGQEQKAETKDLLDGVQKLLTEYEQKVVYVPYRVYPDYVPPYWPEYPIYPAYPTQPWISWNTNTCGLTTDKILLNGDSQTSASDFSITSGSALSSSLCVSAAN